MKDLDDGVDLRPTAEDVEGIFECRCVRLHGDSPWSYALLDEDVAAVLVRGDADIRVLRISRSRRELSDHMDPTLPRNIARQKAWLCLLTEKAKTFWDGPAKFPGPVDWRDELMRTTT